jgi:superfamily II DNA/RNA helicase
MARAGEAGWVLATPVQADAIPAILQGDDVLGLSPTGSGKTAAFLLPVLHRLLAVPGVQDERPRRLRALVLAPTRELAQQIEAGAAALAPALKTVLAVGGVSINPQMMALRGGAHLVVATPGRLLDLLGQRALLLGGVQLLVLDEADRLLDLGFADEIQRVLAWLPARRQTLLFSATLPASVAALADAVLRKDAVRIDARPGGDTPVGDVTQRAIEVDTAQRTPLLRHLIKQERWTRVLVFVATQYASEHVADKLRQAGLPAAALHGQLSAGRRRQALLDLAEGRLAVLVATDLAARGLDVDGLAVVVNHDLPRSAVDYTHRIGRTGRAGVPGLAVSFVCADAPGSEAHFRLIEKRQAQRVPRERVAGFEPAVNTAPAIAPDPQGGIKGRRKSKKDKLREAAGRPGA